MKCYPVPLAAACMAMLLMACGDNQQKKPKAGTKTYQVLTVKSRSATIYHELSVVAGGGGHRSADHHVIFEHQVNKAFVLQFVC